MVKVLVGSKNPVKVEAVREAFSKFFEPLEVVGIEVDSKVSSQPFHAETFLGAKNRALELSKINSEQTLGADYFVGIEGGITNLYSKWFAFGGMCVMDKSGNIGFGMSPHFELPEIMLKEILAGKEMGEVADKFTGEKNTKQKGGTIGFLTSGVMDRKNLYMQGLIVALVPFLNRELYFGEK